jgi:UPF0755 protein
MPPPDERPTEIIRFDDEPELAAFAEQGVPPEDEFQDDYEGEFDDYDDEFEDAEEDGDFYDEDDGGVHAEPEYIEDERPRRRGKRKKRAFGWVAAIVVIALLVGGAWYGVNKIFGYDDYQGTGTTDVLVQVADGDSTNAIAATLLSSGVVASTKAFTKASANNSAITKVQPGYYQLKKEMSGTSAVDRMTTPAARVGVLQIRAFTQFDDVTQPDGKVTPGVYSLLSKASCADMNGKSTCISVDDLRKTVSSTDPAALGVPSWAVGSVNNAPQKDRRLEGLIAPGVYDVMPGWSATELLSHMVKVSAEQIQSSGLDDKSTVEGQSPYQVLVVASIIEREAVQVDFGKVARVIYNRLTTNATNGKLQMDSTINYVLDRPQLATADGDRAKAGAYNTYQNKGLPPTPISAPSPEALKAALQPAAGDWVYFVKCEKSGISCFAATADEHEKNKATARNNGAF